MASGFNAQKAFAPWLDVSGQRLPNPWRPAWTMHIGYRPPADEATRKQDETDAWAERALAAAACSVFFDDLIGTLVNTIARLAAGRIVVGCVAWLSEPRILAALARHCRAVLLLVNDEDYATWGRARGSAPLAEQYSALPAPRVPLAVLFADTPASPLAALPGADYAAVRTCGTRGTLMHSKYLVFLDAASETGPAGPAGRPAAVWTGSMNFTRRSARNQENALLIECPDAAEAYFHDFANSFLVSRPIRDSSAPAAPAAAATESFY
jgi:hypothetical protein